MWFDWPPPWATDCDCCFHECPEAHTCTRAYDMYVACREDSVGTMLSTLVHTYPLTLMMMGTLLVVVYGSRVVQYDHPERRE